MWSIAAKRYEKVSFKMPLRGTFLLVPYFHPQKRHKSIATGVSGHFQNVTQTKLLRMKKPANLTITTVVTLLRVKTTG